MGERACVDTCSHFRLDEGILIGSHSQGLILGCSETHPLPYMPTRPFRVNAGALHSYTLTAAGRTSYLSELRCGSEVLAVDSAGRTRMVTVGRVKIETRPLLALDARAPSGVPVNLIVQDDWHVRVLGPGGAVLNVTELTAGSRVLGYLPTEQRHVGYPIDEFCIEQ
jgi:3-amino-4-hydroxybenzoic acid synthase